eukprot:g11423.t1
MQRLAWSARCCGRRNLTRTLSRFSSSSAGSDHDDFWTAAQSVAKTTPAYQQATQAASDTPSPSVNGDQWAIPGGFGPGRMPMGDAYGPSGTNGDGNNSGPPVFTPSTNRSDQRESYMPESYMPDPVFDMLDSMHLSPIKQADVRSFKGRTLVDIRQYFKGDNGATIPTKKGLSLTIPQWRRLQEAMGDIDSKIQEMEQRGGGSAQGGDEGPGGPAV